MVSEKFSSVVVVVLGQLLMLTGIFYAHSDWNAASAERIDQHLNFGCLVTLGSFLSLRYKVFDASANYNLDAALTFVWKVCPLLAGLNMVRGISVITRESRNSEDLDKVISRNISSFLLYWIAAGILTLGSFLNLILTTKLKPVGCVGCTCKKKDYSPEEVYSPTPATFRMLRNALVDLPPRSKQSRTICSILARTFAKDQFSVELCRWMMRNCLGATQYRRIDARHLHVLGTLCRVCHEDIEVGDWIVFVIGRPVVHQECFEVTMPDALQCAVAGL